MHVYDEKELEGVRAHPWTISDGNPGCRYYDFRRRPELIPIVLEDFVPWSHYAAVEEFYAYLTWLNGPDSELESNDCAFGGVRRNNSEHLTSKKLQVDGRLMVFFRELAMNCDQRNAVYLRDCYRWYLERTQPDLQLAALGLSNLGTYFNAVGKIGSCLVFSFFAWGDSEAEAMDTARHLFAGLKEASSCVCQDYREKIASAIKVSNHASQSEEPEAMR